MIPLTLSQIAELTGGTLAGDPGVVVTGPAFVDSRAPEPGGLFVAVVGEHSDGHTYAEVAVAGGGAAVLGSRPTAAPTVGSRPRQGGVEVARRDPLRAQRDAADGHRPVAPKSRRRVAGGQPAGQLVEAAAGGVTGSRRRQQVVAHHAGEVTGTT